MIAADGKGSDSRSMDFCEKGFDVRKSRFEIKAPSKRNIADIRHVWRTIKAGQVYDPAAIETAMRMR